MLTERSCLSWWFTRHLTTTSTKRRTSLPSLLWSPLEKVQESSNCVNSGSLSQGKPLKSQGLLRVLETIGYRITDWNSTCLLQEWMDRLRDLLPSVVGILQTLLPVHRQQRLHCHPLWFLIHVHGNHENAETVHFMALRESTVSTRATLVIGSTELLHSVWLVDRLPQHRLQDSLLLTRESCHLLCLSYLLPILPAMIRDATMTTITGRSWEDIPTAIL